MHPDDAPLLRRLVYVAAGRPSDSDKDELMAYMVVNSERPGGVYAVFWTVT